MIDIAERQPTALTGRWRRFYEKLRIDIIEAQCAVESGRAARATELMETILHDARRVGIHMDPPDPNSQAPLIVAASAARCP